MFFLLHGSCCSLLKVGKRFSSVQPCRDKLRYSRRRLPCARFIPVEGVSFVDSCGGNFSVKGTSINFLPQTCFSRLPIIPSPCNHEYPDTLTHPRLQHNTPYVPCSAHLGQFRAGSRVDSAFEIWRAVVKQAPQSFLPRSENEPNNGEENMYNSFSTDCGNPRSAVQTVQRVGAAVTSLKFWESAFVLLIYAIAERVMCYQCALRENSGWGGGAAAFSLAEPLVTGGIKRSVRLLLMLPGRVTTWVFGRSSPILRVKS